MRDYSLLVLGEPASKSNSRRLVNRGGKPMFIKSAKALAYEAAAIPQIRAQMNKNRWRMIEKPCCLEAEIFYASRRPDLDESLIMDVLEKAGVYKNDRLIEEKHIYKHLDKDNPRSLITVYEIESM